MRSVTICSSSRFFPEAKMVAERLRAENSEVFTPSFVHGGTKAKVDHQAKAQLTHDFLRKIDKSDLIYVVAQDGYVGCSVATEIGYATALGKPVVLSEEAKEDSIKALTTSVVSLEEVSQSTLKSL